MENKKEKSNFSKKANFKGKSLNNGKPKDGGKPKFNGNPKNGGKPKFNGKPKNGGKSQSNVITDWLYMNSKEISVVDIKKVLKDDFELEVWKEAGVLEVEIEEASLDFEMSNRLSFKDEIADTYVKDNDIHVMFYVSFKSEIETKAHEVMKKIATDLGGEFLADTEDLMPRIK